MPKIRKFPTFNEIPNDFSGEAYCLKQGAKVWFKNGVLHRENGPALVYIARGIKIWFQNGKMHRKDKPAIKTPTKLEWCWKGNTSRLDGPAVIWFNSEGKIVSKTFSIDKMWFTEEEYWEHPLVLKHKLNKILKQL